MLFTSRGVIDLLCESLCESELLAAHDRAAGCFWRRAVLVFNSTGSQSWMKLWGENRWEGICWLQEVSTSRQMTTNSRTKRNWKIPRLQRVRVYLKLFWACTNKWLTQPLFQSATCLSGCLLMAKFWLSVEMLQPQSKQHFPQAALIDSWPPGGQEGSKTNWWQQSFDLTCAHG